MKKKTVIDPETGFREVFEVDPETGVRTGTYEKFNASGQILESAQYDADMLHGERILYYDNGNAEIMETYREGQFEGLYQTFYKSGHLQLEGLYQNGKMEGVWKKYDTSGAIMEEVTFRDNEENGPFVEYYRDGTIKAEGAYLNGDHEHGLVKLYAPDGSLAKTLDCNRGICRTTWEKEKADE